MQGRLIIVADDEVVVGRIRAAATALGVESEAVSVVGDTESRTEPLAIVMDLEIEDAWDAAGRLRARWPRTLIAGFISRPDRSRWERALESGYNLVATRGAIAAQLRDALSSWTGPATARRVRLFDAGDVVGRLGVVARLAETPVGAIAVYQIGGRLYASGDVCPHAGAVLSHGELEGPVVTCPRHGSRFDVRTGERVRGPADEAIRVFPVVVDGGTAYLEID